MTASRTYKRHIAISLALILAIDGAAGDDLREEQNNELIFGAHANMGRVLVDDLKNACHHARDVVATADPSLRTLLLADRKMTAFDAQACNGVCDQLQINNIVVRCRRERSIPDCVIYGAVYEKQVYSFSIDPKGFNLEKDCTN